VQLEVGVRTVERVPTAGPLKADRLFYHEAHNGGDESKSEPIEKPPPLDIDAGFGSIASGNKSGEKAEKDGEEGEHESEVSEETDDELVVLMNAQADEEHSEEVDAFGEGSNILGWMQRGDVDEVDGQRYKEDE
jgi:hypothetical protein